jgi:hypothetical protein
VRYLFAVILFLPGAYCAFVVFMISRVLRSAAVISHPTYIQVVGYPLPAFYVIAGLCGLAFVFCFAGAYLLVSKSSDDRAA